MNKLTIIIALTLMAFSAPVLAITPYVCDPDVDTHGCACPTNLGAAGLDSCSVEDHGDLVEASDASTLATYIDATWVNESGGYYLVEIDAESMPAAGVIRLGSGAGEWDDTEELRDFWRVLLDDSSLELETSWTMTGFTIHLLPPMRVIQRGATHRFDDVTGEWALRNSYNLLLDVITNESGFIEIGSNDPMSVFGGDECPGTDPDSIDSAVDSDLKGVQCSDSNDGVFYDFGDALCESAQEYCVAIIQLAHTTLETASTIQYGNTLHCSNEDGGIECDLVEGWFTAERALADEISITNDYYSNTWHMFGVTRTEDDVMELDLASTRANGICASGTAEAGTDDVEVNTKDGEYDASALPCDF